jgi:hypothetical protein
LAGSHRAPRRNTPRTRQGRTAALPAWAIVVAIVAALIPATALTAHRLVSSDDEPSSHSSDLPIPPVSPSSSAQPGPTETAAPPAEQPKALPRVAPDAPRRISAGQLIDSGFDEAVTDLEPGSASEVARWEPRGSPGSPGPDTVYVIGQVDDDSAFARLPELKPGGTVRLTTDNGVLTYTVSAATLKREDGLAQSSLFRTHKAGRLVLVGVRYDDSGDRLDKALVVTAQLTGANRA